MPLVVWLRIIYPLAEATCSNRTNMTSKLLHFHAMSYYAMCPIFFARDAFSNAKSVASNCIKRHVMLCFCSGPQSYPQHGSLSSDCLSYSSFLFRLRVVTTTHPQYGFLLCLPSSSHMTQKFYPLHFAFLNLPAPFVFTFPPALAPAPSSSPFKCTIVKSAARLFISPPPS